MGDLWLQVLPRDDRDLTTLSRAFQPKMLAEDVIGYETMILADPADIDLHDDVALLYLQLGRASEAVVHFEASAKLRPQSPAVHFNLGTALTMAGRLDDAVSQYGEALRIEPGYANAHNNLADVLSAQNKLDDAIRHYRDALRSDPRHAAAHNNLGSALMRQNRTAEALPHLVEALRINPEYADAHYNIGDAYMRGGQSAEALEHFRQVVRLRPDWTPGLARLAWLLATAPQEALHDPKQAVWLAERAATLEGRRDFRTLDVLAAAYADAGMFDRALPTVDAALQLKPPDPLAADIGQRQSLYRAHRPYRMPVSK
jgi:tetratricopeptide (TPR) repeat protein